MSQRTRHIRGSTIAEFGPALFIFLIAAFFPLLSMLALVANYGAGFYLNYTAANAVARVKQSEGMSALADQDQSFIASGIGKLLGLTKDAISHSLTYRDAQLTQPATTDQPAIPAVPARIEVSTTFTIKPFLNHIIPFIGKVPGLTSPVKFAYHTEIPREETE